MDNNFLTEIKENLLKLPESISIQQSKLFTVTRERNDVEAKIKALRLNLSVFIQSEMDSITGKPIYSNDVARSAQLVAREAADSKMVGLQKELQELDKVVFEHQNQLALETNKFSAYKHLSDLYAGYFRKQS